MFSVHVSQPYSKTGITSDLRIRNFVILHRYRQRQILVLSESITPWTRLIHRKTWPVVSRDALNQTLSWDRHRLQTSPVETNVGAPPLRLSMVSCWAIKHEPWLFSSLILKLVTANLQLYQVSEHLTWYAEQRYTTIVVAVLTVSFPFPDKDNQPLFSVRRNGTWIPYINQNTMQTTDHALASRFEQLHTDVTNASCLSTPQTCHRLFVLMKRGYSFVNKYISIYQL